MLCDMMDMLNEIGGEKVWIESIPDKGFTLRQSSPPTGLFGRVLSLGLKLEDDAWLGYEIKRRHHLMHIAYTLDEAKSYAEAFNPHVIFMNADQPGTDAFEVCREFSDDLKRGVTVLDYKTDDFNHKQELRWLGFGAFKYFDKSYDNRLLVSYALSVLPRRFG
jgi:CheY-like chemotaxis protein